MVTNRNNKSEIHLGSDNVKRKGRKPRAGRIFVVEEIQAQQARAFKSKDIHGHQLLNPIEKSTIKLFFWDITYLLTILLVCILWSIPVTVIPMTNTIIFPSRWWEMIFNGTFFANSLYVAGLTILEIKIIFNLKVSNLLRPFAWSFALIFLSTTIPYCTSYLVWPVWLGYNHPIPLVGLICYLSWYTTHYASIWFMFPKEMRKNKSENRKICAYILYRLWLFFIALQRMPLNAVIGMLEDSQWIMAIVLPASREMNLWMLKQIWKNWIDPSVNLLLISDVTSTVLINMHHAVWATIVICTKTSRFTTYCILAADVILNLYATLTIIKRHRLVSPTSDSGVERNGVKEDAVKLSGIEMVEFLTPIAYSITFAMVFYGPNSDIIGGVKFSGWQYSEVIDIGSYLIESGMMFIADFVCMVVSGVLLWKFTSINLIEEGYKILNFYCPLIAVNMAGTMFTVNLLIFKRCILDKIWCSA